MSTKIPGGRKRKASSDKNKETKDDDSVPPTPTNSPMAKKPRTRQDEREHIQEEKKTKDIKSSSQGSKAKSASHESTGMDTAMDSSTATASTSTTAAVTTTTASTASSSSSCATTTTKTMVNLHDLEVALAQASYDLEHNATAIRLPDDYIHIQGVSKTGYGVIMEWKDDETSLSKRLAFVPTPDEWPTCPGSLSSKCRSLVWENRLSAHAAAMIANKTTATFKSDVVLPRDWTFNPTHCSAWCRTASGKGIVLVDAGFMKHKPIEISSIKENLDMAIAMVSQVDTPDFHKSTPNFEHDMKKQVALEIKQMNAAYGNEDLSGHPHVWEAKGWHDMVKDCRTWLDKMKRLLEHSAGSQYGSYEMQCILRAAVKLVGAHRMAAYCLHKADQVDSPIASVKQSIYDAWMGIVSMLVVLGEPQLSDIAIFNMKDMAGWVVQRKRPSTSSDKDDHQDL